MKKMKFRWLVISIFTLFAVCASAQAFEWTRWTSEEKEPRTCDFNEFQSGIQCSGSYCDNVRLECHNPGITGLNNRHWASQISEENGGTRFCPYGYFVTGASFSGKYGDNISLECSKATGTNWKPKTFRWTQWKSEEGGGRNLFPVGYYAIGVQCKGKYCDSKRYRISRAK